MSRFDPTGAAMSRLGFDPTGVRDAGTAGRGALTGDPTGVRTSKTGFGGFDPLMDWGIKALEEQNAKNAAADAQFNNFFAPMQPQMGGQAVALGGEWAGVDRWNDAISQASAKYGVPINLIKAVMKLESDGDPNSTGAPGVWGPMQVNSSSWGYGPWSTDPVANIFKGVEILKDGYHGDWNQALIAYRGGWGSDGYTTGQQYLDIVNGNWNKLNSATGGGTAGSGFNPGTASGNLTSMFTSQNISQEFNVHGGPDLYGYGTAYGLDGASHTGLDISMPHGTPYRSPGAGTVTCAGTNNGPGADGGGCAAFQDTDTGGAGRVEIQMDNGVVLIFGHSQSSAVRVGQRVTPGMILGASGGMNGGHVHLEARVRDASMPSGWRIVDPRSVLGGSAPMYGGSYPGAQQGAGAGGAMDMNAMIIHFLTTPGATW